MFRKENGHISRATNSALQIATGEFVGLLDNDDELAPQALFEVAKAINSNLKLDLIYSDEDKIDEKGNRSDPHFKPDYSPDLLLSTNYISHFGVYRKAIVDEIGGFRVGYEGSQDYDFVLRFVEKTTPDRIWHIARFYIIGVRSQLRRHLVVAQRAMHRMRGCVLFNQHGTPWY